MRLRELRVQRLLTLSQLARLAHMNRWTIQAIELGHNRPRFTTIRRVAAALDVDPLEVDEFRTTIEELGES